MKYTESYLKNIYDEAYKGAGIVWIAGTDRGIEYGLVRGSAIVEPDEDMPFAAMARIYTKFEPDVNTLYLVKLGSGDFFKVVRTVEMLSNLLAAELIKKALSRLIDYEKETLLDPGFCHLSRIVATRALRIRKFDSFDLMALRMALVAVNKLDMELDLAGLLSFADDDFMHDVEGITDYLDIYSGKLGSCFVPKCAR